MPLHFLAVWHCILLSSMMLRSKLVLSLSGNMRGDRSP
jgi:hypothetical protein